MFKDMRTLWLAIVILALGACFGYRTRTVPSVDPGLSSKGMIGKVVVLATELGPVGLKLDSLGYPYIMGNATSHGGVAQVRIDQYVRYAVVVLDDSGRITSRRTLRPRDVLSNPALLVGNSIRFSGDRGDIILRDVTRVDSPWAEGRLVAGNGPIRADLREGRTLDIADISVGKSLGFTTIAAAVTVVVIALLYLSSGSIFR